MVPGLIDHCQRDDFGKERQNNSGNNIGKKRKGQVIKRKKIEDLTE